MATLTRYNRQGNRAGTIMPLPEAINQLLRDAVTAPFGGDALVGLTSGMNLYERDDRYIVQVPLPGVKPDQLTITARENVVTLQGTMEFSAPEGARPLVQNAGAGEFREQVVLPGDVDAERAEAQYQDGILTLTLPKAAHAKERTISVQAGQAQTGRSAAQGQTQPQAQAQEGAQSHADASRTQR